MVSLAPLQERRRPGYPFCSQDFTDEPFAGTRRKMKGCKHPEEGGKGPGVQVPEGTGQ